MKQRTHAGILIVGLFVVVLPMIASSVFGQGRVLFEGPMDSRILGTNRFVRIYLPPSYEHSPRKRYPVLYLHDGQNAFTTVGDHVAFGWGNWQLDKTATALSATGKMQEIIIVAVDCSSERYLDYRGPAYPYSEQELSAMKRRPFAPRDNSRFERYSRFLIEELKPRIDREYRTKRDAANTAVMGSSLGGICSLVLAWEHPQIFGKAASLSGSFQVEKKYFLQEVLLRYKGRPKRFKMYLDSGVVDYSGGDDNHAATEAVANELRRIGWRDGKNLLHYVDSEPLRESDLESLDVPRGKWKEAQTSQHNELYWRVRAWRPLTFLFPG